MDDILIKILKSLNSTPNEIKLYIAGFKTGPSTVPEIAKSARVKRSTAYLLIKDMVDRGLFIEDHKNYDNKLYPINPDQLLKKLSGKQRALRRQEIEFEENLPILRSAYQSSEIHPKVRMFQGNSGLVSIWQDILSTKSDIMLWTNQQTENQFFNEQNHNKFIEERVSKKIKIKVLAVDNIQSRELQKTDKDKLRETKILPTDTIFSVETYLYDNKVAMLDYNKDVIGIITESKPFFEFHKSIFENTWSKI